MMGPGCVCTDRMELLVELLEVINHSGSIYAALQTLLPLDGQYSQERATRFSHDNPPGLRDLFCILRAIKMWVLGRRLGTELATQHQPS